MTAKEKAKKLLEKFEQLLNNNDRYWKSEAHDCALIAVDEIIKANPHSNPFNTDVCSTMNYWQEVKREIKNL